MADNLGSGVSRSLEAGERQFDYVAWQKGKPPLDSELNLIGQTHTEQRAEILRSLVPSGFLGNGINPQDDYWTHESYSNIFFLGRQNETIVGRQAQITSGVQRNPVAIVNGWVIPLIGSRVNLGSIVKNDNDKRNLIELPFGPTTGFATNFVFLEVWRQLVRPNSTVGKPSTNELWKFGNVEFGGTNIPDGLLDPALSFETTLRVQLQYRIRVLPAVNILTHPDGFGDTTVVFGRGNLTEAAASGLGFTFTNMADGMNDQGLWRSGDGDPNNGLGTVDGYTYAVPIAAVHRRNRGGFDLNNVNGSLTRVSPPSGYVEGNQSGSILSDLELDAVGASDRPDGKYADAIVAGDITDLRHVVNPGGFDYDSILKHNLGAVFQGELKTSPKSFSAGGTRLGPELLYIDEITGGADNPGTTTIGTPDGVRRVFSDAMVPQDNNVSLVTPDVKDAGSPSKSFKPNSWEPEDIIKLPLPSSLNAGENAARFLPERTRISLVGGTQPLASGSVTSATATSITVESGKLLSIYEGRAIRITSGTGAGQVRTLTNPVTPPSSTISPAWTTIPDSTSTFEVLEFYTEISAVIDANSQLEITIVNLNGQTTFADAGPVAGNFTDDLVIEYSLLYPAGNGLALRPDKFHEVNYTNPNTNVLVRETNLSKNLLGLAYIQYDPDYCNQTFVEVKLHGTALNGTSNTITVGDLIDSNGADLACGPLDHTEDSAAALLEGGRITLCRGPGAGQTRTILSYNTATGIMVVNTPWDTQPTSLTQFEIVQFQDTRSYFGNELRNTEAYFDPGSKTVKVQPWQDVSETFQFEAVQFDEVLKNAGLNDYFDTSFVIDLPRSFLPPISRQDIPILSVNQNAFPAGLNGPIFKIVGDINANDQLVQHFGRVSETAIGNAVFEVSPGLTYEDRNTADPLVDRIGCQFNEEVAGIEFPRHFGLSRVRAVFEKADFDSLGFNATNLFQPNNDANPLNSSMLISRQTDPEVVTFTLYGNTISGFTDTNSYVVIADVFGYDKGFLVDNGRVFATNSVAVADGDSYTAHLLLTRPLPVGSITQVAYSREPYQGDIYNSVEPFADTSPEPFNNRGLPTGEQLGQLDQPLEDPTRGDEFTYEILAEVQFATTAGTGRFSGESPHCDVFDVASVNPKEPYYPRLDLGDINTDLGGLTTRLPMGARWRDAHFVADNFLFGERFSNFVPFMGSAGPYHKVLDNDSNSDYSQNGLTVGAELTLTEAKNASYGTPDQYRVTRGGAAYMRDGKRPGGAFGGTGGRGESGFNLMYGVAALVRNYRETSSSVDKSFGGELQLVVGTSADGPGQKMFSIAVNPSGVGEGDAAVDRFRTRGRLLEKQRKSVTYTSLTTLMGNGFTNSLPAPKIRTVNPLVVDQGDEITIVGENFGSTLFLRDAQSGALTLVNMREHAFEFDKDKIRFSIPSYVSQFPTTGDGTLLDVAIQNPDGQLDIREGAVLLRPDGLGGSTNKQLFFEGFEGYRLGSQPPENNDSAIGDAWVTTGFTTSLATPAGEGYVLQDGLLASDACSLSPHCGHFRGLSEEDNNNPTTANFLATQNSTLDIAAKVSTTLTATHSLSFAVRYGDYPGQEVLNAGFFTSTGSGATKNTEALVEVLRNNASATYILQLGAAVEGTTVVVDTNVSLDNAFHEIELLMWPSAGNYTLLFDGIVQRTGNSLTPLMSLTTEELRTFEIEANQPVQNGSLPGVRVELFVDNISVRQLN